MMDPFVAAARMPSGSASGSRSFSSSSDDADDDDEDDDDGGRRSRSSGAPPVNYLEDSDSVVFVGEVSEPTINALCHVDVCIRQDGEFAPRDLSSTPMHECRWEGCNLRFALLDQMVVHVNDDHVRMEDVNYTCKWEACTRQGRSFNARYKMLIHMRTHTNEKPHRCPTCDKRFSRLENLKIHNRSHTGEKPYVCPIKGCGKAYSNSSDRFKHTRTHFDDKPFVCKRAGCGKRYTDPSSLRKHTKTFGHRDQPTANNRSAGSGSTSNAVAVDLSDVGTTLLFNSRVRYGMLTMHPDDTVSASKKPAPRKSKNNGIKKVSSAGDAPAKLPAGHIDHRTITID